MTAKRVLSVAALLALLLGAVDRAAAQGIPATQPTFIPGGPVPSFRGPFPGFKFGPINLPSTVHGRNPTVIYGVASANGIVTPAAYLGNNLGATLDSTYQQIVSSNATLTLSQNVGQFGQFGNLGSLGGVAGGQLGQQQGGQLGQQLGGQLGQMGGVGGKLGAGGGAVGVLGAFGSRDYGI